ncbi:hypothetical protein JCM3765_007544 [Sporobolomyces pararoseus]
MSTETTNNVESTRNDYLSRLPNELLEDIFDYAYSSSPPPPMPLSKRLLPFHQKHLYRQITLSSPTQVNIFLASISSNKEKGKMVKEIEFDRSRDGVVESIEVLENLFPLLPNLQHLDLRSQEIEVCQQSNILFGTLTNITSVITEPVSVYDRIDLDHFAFLSTLPSLNKLEIYDWPPSTGYCLTHEGRFELAHLKSLKIQGEGAEESTAANLAKLCPALLHLELNSTWDDVLDFDRCITQIPARPESLQLSSQYTPHANLSPHLLLRFTNLRSLDLADGCYSKTIHTALQLLPLLKKIRLGGGAISPPSFLTLLSGPARLVHLEIVILDFYVGERGICVVDLSEDLEMEDWKMPRASVKEAEEGEPDEDPLQLGELRQLIEVAEENGVEVKGSCHEALENLQDFWIEKNNRAILSAYNGHDDEFLWLQTVRRDAVVAGVALPSFDIDSLDPDHLELVKTELPERDWFILSLMSRSQVTPNREEEYKKEDGKLSVVQLEKLS